MVATPRQASAAPTDAQAVILVQAGCKPNEIKFSFGGDLRYMGQQNEVTVTFDADPRIKRDIPTIRAAFEEAYEAQYGLRLPENAVEMVSWRLTCHGPHIQRTANAVVASTPGKLLGTRAVRLGGPTSTTFQRFAREALASGQRIDGPALVEERETTTVILPGWTAVLHATGCLIAERH